MSKVAELHYDGSVIELPVVEGSEQEKAIDISKLRATSGLITLDPGFKNTGSTTSEITFLNGEEGILRYRGYAIEDLANKASFLEVAYLLVYGALPSTAQYETFTQKIKTKASIPAEIKTIMSGFPKDAHPMGVLSATISALTAYYPEALNPNLSKEETEEVIIDLIAKVPVLASWWYKTSKGEEVVAPDENLDYCENFMNMMFGECDAKIADALNKLLILHADHEQNCSTATVRVVGSSHASLYSSIAAGVSALWGPLHGGANQAVIEMLEAIKNDGGDTDRYLDKAKDKADPFRLMGFGHRVYKNFDPRARIIKVACDNVLDLLGIDDPVLDIAKGLESAALNDEYFKARKLYPNVDFYSGIIYRALGIPVEMFTVMFAIGRLPGWIAQWKEMRETGQPIGRPRQVYTGSNLSEFKDLSAR